MGSKESTVKHSDLFCKSRSSTEISEKNKKDESMDLESSIDTWVIDKEDSNGSCYALNKYESNFAQLNAVNTFDKENFTKGTNLTDKKSLRSFRIRKNISYNEISSESENEFIENFFPKDEYSYDSKNQQSQKSQVSDSNEKLAQVLERESLSSEEISLYLSELDNSSDDNSQKVCREHLLSIENVDTGVESKVTDINISPVAFKVNSSNMCPTSEQQLIPSNKSSNKTSFLSENTTQSLRQNQTNYELNFSSSVIKNKSEFLDSFKSHLSNKIIHNEKMSKQETGSFKTYDSKKAKNYSSYNQKVLKCSICSHCCSDLLLHKSHMILFHSENKILDCEYCDYKTSQCANLATHIRVHFQLECPHCDYQCPLENSLESHLFSCHREKKQYQCKKCNYICKSQIKFKKHTQLHQGLGKYICSDCNLAFQNKKFLRVHVKNHINKRKTFKCLSCQLSFLKKKELKIHLRSHEQVYVCNLCNYKCPYKEKLEIHMKTHSRKYLKCGKCSLIFSRKCNLKLHMQVHFPDLKCHYCPFQASNSNELSKHVCIKKLYNVKKRTLSFEKESKIVCKVKNKITSEGDLKSNLKSVNVEGVEKENEQVKLRSVLSNSAPQTRNRKPNRRRLLSLRRHLPSRVTEQPISDKNNYETVNGTRDVDKSFKTLRKCKRFSQERKCAYQTRNSLKQSSCLNDETEETNSREPYEFRNRRKMISIGSISLSCIEVLFKKRLTPKEILLQPVRFTNGSYIQCYYQSQPTMSIPNHLERHVRQSTLLSCRFCNYKTNSSQLLQRHTAKFHTWDPAVVSMLFS